MTIEKPTNPSSVIENESIVSENEPIKKETSLADKGGAISVELVQLKEKIASITEYAEKITLILEVMQQKLSEKSAPAFRYFWDVKIFCLQLFKEMPFVSKKPEMWTEYQDLIKEAKRIKEEFNQESAFASEQLDIAIKSLEDDYLNYQDRLKEIEAFTFPVACKTLQKKQSFYEEWQRELNLLNTQITRLNSLRKEVMKTGMRYRQKHLCFDRLSKIGDGVFVKRKDLIKQISEKFLEDIEAFCQMHFSNKKSTLPYYLLRDEIKALQQLAKTFTLNTHSFSVTRKQLSRCWDQVKELEKDYRKAREEKKDIYKANIELVRKKILDNADLLKEAPLFEVKQFLADTSAYMKTLELGKKEIIALKEQLQPYYDLIQTKENEKTKAKEKRQQEKKEKKEGQLHQLKEEIQDLLNQEISLAQIETHITRLHQVVEAKSFTENEKRDCYNALHDIEDKLIQNGVKLQPSSEEGLSVLNTYRKKLKNHIETYRKMLGGSSLDFESSMTYNELIQIEKSRLEAIEAAIHHVYKS